VPTLIHALAKSGDKHRAKLGSITLVVSGGAPLSDEIRREWKVVSPARLAEGYGLPPLEAAALGRPVLCNALAICRELLGTRAVYADGTDVYQWRKIISDWTGSAPPATRPAFDPPSWADHFKTVLGVT